MAQNKRHKTYAYSIGFMVTITLVMIGALALINEATVARIQQNAEIKNQEKVLEAANLLPEEASDQVIQDLYQRSFSPMDYDGQTLYHFGETTYVLPVSGQGVWGNITAYIGIDFPSKRLLGFSIVSHSETPGLGGRIEEGAYLDQFDDLSLAGQGEYLIYRPTPGGNIDAISGATGTSKAVLNFLNADLNRYLDAYQRGVIQ